jgi:hypothetical protein
MFKIALKDDEMIQFTLRGRLIQQLGLTVLCVFFLLATYKLAYAQTPDDVVAVPFEILVLGAILGPVLILAGVVNSYREDEKLRKKIQPVASKTRRPQDADVTVFAPPNSRPVSDIIVQVVIHTPDREGEARRRTQTTDSTSQNLASAPLTIQLKIADKIKVTIDCDRADIDEPVQTTSWNGRLVCIDFKMRLPNVTEPLTLIPKVRVFVNAVPAGNVIFKINVVPSSQEFPQSFAPREVRAYSKPFLSYAHEDRLQVLRAAQVISALKMEFFQDVLKITPGERWERRLYSEIERCDVFLLFWSRHAKASKWVVSEAEYALQVSKNVLGQPLEIIPILLEGPPPPDPPPSLQEIQFNDPIKYVIFAEEMAVNRWHRRFYPVLHSRLFWLTVGLVWLVALCALAWKVIPLLIWWVADLFL